MTCRAHAGPSPDLPRWGDLVAVGHGAPSMLVVDVAMPGCPSHVVCCAWLRAGQSLGYVSGVFDGRALHVVRRASHPPIPP